MKEFDEIVDGAVPEGPLPEPPDQTPVAGQMYQRLPDEPAYPVIEVEWQHPKHEVWAQLRRAKGQEPPFYVRLPSGAIGWVPWPGSTIVTRYERAWQMDLLRDDVSADLVPSQAKRPR